jgi:small ligand-binding sensory domain FIST
MTMARDRTPNTRQSIRFASALTFETDAKMAALELGARIKRALEGDRVDLALVFATSHYAEEAHALLERVRDALSPRVLVGCSGEGVIGPEREVEGEQAVAVVAAHLPDVDLRSFDLVPAEILQAAESPLELKKVVHVPKETRAFILLGDPFSAQIDGLLRAFNTVHPGVPVIGGMASGALTPGEMALFSGDHTFRQGAVGVAMAGSIDVNVIVSQGCRPVGPLFAVTAAEANIIAQLEGRPPLEQLQAVVAELSEEDRALLRNGLFVGRAIDSSKEMLGRGDFLVRGVVDVDRRTGAIAIGDFVGQGEIVQFHLRDAVTAAEDLEMLLSPQSFFGRPSGAFLFSCNGRGTRLYDHPNGDISAVNAFFAGMPVAGFFCAGEIGPIGGRNFLHGHTAILALIRPGSPHDRD